MDGSPHHIIHEFGNDMREFAGGGDCGIGGTLKLGIVIFKTGHTCSPLQPGNGNIFIMDIQVGGFP